jgi:signal transduction histidine kinase
VPLVAGDRALGLFSMDKAQPHFFTGEHQQMAEAIASQAAIAIHNAQLYEEVRAGQERLRQLAQQVVVAQEAERQRVSRELHDEAGQALVALKFQLEMVRDDLPQEAKQLAARIDVTANLIETTMHRIRLLAHDLRPPALETVGLNRVLEDMCYELAGRTRLAIEYRGEDLPDLTSAMSIGLYRILQEALTNVIKHARARTVQVTLKCENHCVHLCVEDDGQGFEGAARQAEPTGNGIGLIGMRERVQLLRGELVFEARPGGGTRLMARVPYPTER